MIWSYKRTSFSQGVVFALRNVCLKKKKLVGIYNNRHPHEPNSQKRRRLSSVCGCLQGNVLPSKSCLYDWISLPVSKNRSFSEIVSVCDRNVKHARSVCCLKRLVLRWRSACCWGGAHSSSSSHIPSKAACTRSFYCKLTKGEFRRSAI